MAISEKLKHELTKNLASRQWRLENLYSIKTKEEGVQPFVPNWGQRRVWAQQTQRRAYRQAILKVRQLGMSTGTIYYNLDDALFRPNGKVDCGIIDITEVKGRDKVRIAKDAYRWMADPSFSRYPELGKLVHSEIKTTTDNASHIAFSNGSRVRTAMSFVGETLQRLHVSDAGKIAYEDPERTGEIQETFESMPMRSHIMMEGTHKGGQAGFFYDICQEALETVPNETTGHVLPLEWDFVFLEWFSHPDYEFKPEDIEGRKLDEKTIYYFSELKDRYGIELPDTRKHWWEFKSKTLKKEMAVQYPSVPQEAWAAPVEGAFYGDIIDTLRIDGKIRDYPVHTERPLFACFDIGYTDYTSIWTFQQIGHEFLWLDYYQNSGEQVPHYADVLRNLERVLGKTYACLLLPHDGAHGGITGLTAEETFRREGFETVVIPRAPQMDEVMTDINHGRTILERSFFHKRCDERRLVDGKEQPSGIGYLSAYRRKVVQSGAVITERPVHDDASHCADSFRTFLRAHRLKIMDTQVGRTRMQAVTRSRGKKFAKCGFKG